MKIISFALSIGLSFILSACAVTHNYQPDADTYSFPEISDFSSAQDVSVINDSQATEPFLYGEAGMGNSHKWMGNLKEWTDIAVEITNRELANRGMQINPNASRTLKLAILEANATSGGWGFRGNVALKATTGSGYERVYQGESPAMMINRSADGAIMQAVAAMLRDTHIVSYLTE